MCLSGASLLHSGFALGNVQRWLAEGVFVSMFVSHTCQSTSHFIEKATVCTSKSSFAVKQTCWFLTFGMVILSDTDSRCRS